MKPMIFEFLLSCIAEGWSDANFTSLLRICCRFAVEEKEQQPHLVFSFLDALVRAVFERSPTLPLSEKDSGATVQGWSVNVFHSSWQFVQEMADILGVFEWTNEGSDIVCKVLLTISRFLGICFDQLAGAAEHLQTIEVDQISSMLLVLWDRI